jgi:tetratricopeptide (TPR) repeat protein
MIATVERRRPRVLVITVCLVLFALSRNTKHVAAKKSWRSTPSFSAIIPDTVTPSRSSLPGSRISILRGGSLEEESTKSSEEDGSETLGKSGASSSEETEPAEGGVVDLEANSDAGVVEIATALRLEGKKHHDQGDFVKAAEVFQRAADILLNGDGDDDNAESSSSTRMSEDYATCRLHQALCNLKSENYELCIEACTDVLQDNSDDTNSGSTHLPAINARAYHRRAKAKMALGDNSGALQDARTASFLGDGKAVNLYGKLMRETSSSDLSSVMNPLLSPGSSPSSSSLSPVSPHAALLESLINKSSGGNESGSSPGGFPDFSPASLLMGNGGGGNLLGALGSGGGGMAKSLVTNLVKRLDDESTQVTICDFLQKTNKAQLVSLASMAGIDNALEDSQLEKLVNFCHRITPKGIRRTVRGTKVVVYFVKVIRRTIKVINKYKSLIVAALILQWMKSAMLRPLPINTKAVKKAAKLAAKEALKASRAGFF